MFRPPHVGQWPLPRRLPCAALELPCPDLDSPSPPQTDTPFQTSKGWKPKAVSSCGIHLTPRAASFVMLVRTQSVSRLMDV